TVTAGAGGAALSLCACAGSESEVNATNNKDLMAHPIGPRDFVVVPAEAMPTSLIIMPNYASTV
ncbi:hypothetical protein, partial [Tritonibacter mobilis]|uniref:hypothetical protein n=1 Tax=Tritonibacter mobilis TaxID=379347 RepID=UPI0019550C9A